MKHVKKIALLGAICLVLASCNGYEKLLNSNDYEAKYEAAMRYYKNNSYNRATQLFENLSLHYRGREHAEEIAWCYADALMKQQEYISAGYHYRRFASQYPYSEHAEDALYLSAYCKYLNSPTYSLDQTLTREAIEDMEMFAERWPRSVHIPEVNRYLDEMRAKLMKKDYEIAYGYYFIEEYHAAYQSFQAFLNLYPDTEMREDAMFYQLDAGYRYAINSREDKKKERLQQVINDFEKFSSYFNNSRHLPAAQTIYTDTRAALAQMENDKTANKQ